MLKPICLNCHRFFRSKKMGVYFTEGMPTHNGAAPGLAEPENWKPYKIWSADLWQCDGCGFKILAGFGLQPIRHQHEDDFADVQKKLGADKYQVNDC
jgi:hypothetical protein